MYKAETRLAKAKQEASLASTSHSSSSHQHHRAGGGGGGGGSPLSSRFGDHAHHEVLLTVFAPSSGGTAPAGAAHLRLPHPPLALSDGTDVSRHRQQQQHASGSLHGAATPSSGRGGGGGGGRPPSEPGSREVVLEQLQRAQSRPTVVQLQRGGSGHLSGLLWRLVQFDGADDGNPGDARLHRCVREGRALASRCPTTRFVEYAGMRQLPGHQTGGGQAGGPAVARMRLRACCGAPAQAHGGCTARILPRRPSRGSSPHPPSSWAQARPRLSSRCNAPHPPSSGASARPCRPNRGTSQHAHVRAC